MTDITQIEGRENSAPYPKEFFKNQWKFYQKVMNNNYMKYREFYGVLHKFLVSYFPNQFSLLDLGCGDASWEHPIFA